MREEIPPAAAEMRVGVHSGGAPPLELSNLGGNALAQGPINASAQCYNHPARDGVGLCVRCRRVICVECGTRIDGINYCYPCLQAAWQPAPSQRPAAASSPAAGVLLTVISFALMTGLFMFAGLVISSYLR